MKNHGLWMLIGCVLPLMLIFLLPLFGVSEGIALVIFLILMLGCHLTMFFGHGGDGSHAHNRDNEKEKL